MKIKVTEERECCDERKDLVVYRGSRFPGQSALMFCKHCGQLWAPGRRMDAAGSMEDYLKKIDAPNA
jgi:NMD protein affecting ribosome stability and mRNA decay